MKIFFVKNVFAKNMFGNTFFDWDLNENLNKWTYWIEFNLTRIESIWIESIWIELDWIEVTSSSLSVVRRLSSFVRCLTWLFEENIHDSAPDERPPKFNCFSFRKPNTKSPNWQKASGAQNALRPPLCTIRPAPALGGEWHLWAWLSTAVLQTFISKISRTPYYSSSWDVPILLYESLKILK